MLVIANETVAGRSLIEAIERRRKDGPVRVTVITPVNQPREGYVVYEDTRRAAAGRRLEKTLEALRAAGIPASGLVVETDPVAATRDAIATLEPRPDEIVVSTHPQQRSGWLRKNVVERIEDAAGGLPVEHVVVDLEREDGGEANVLVVANETVVGEPLLEKIRERAAEGPGLVPDHLAAERRRARAPRGRAPPAPGADDPARRGHRRPRPGRAPGSVHGGRPGGSGRARRRDHRLDLPGREDLQLAARRPRQPAAQGDRPAGRARRGRAREEAVV